MVPIDVSNGPDDDVERNMVLIAVPGDIVHDILIELDERVTAFTIDGGAGGRGSVDAEPAADSADVPPAFDALIL